MTLSDLFVAQLQDLHSAHGLAGRALRRMAQAAGSDSLREALVEQAQQSGQQRDRIERVCRSLNAAAVGRPCRCVHGLIEQAGELISPDAPPNVRDAAIAATARRLEQYEAGGCAVTRGLALELGEAEAADQLQVSLDETQEADRSLAEITQWDLDLAGRGEPCAARALQRARDEAGTPHAPAGNDRYPFGPAARRSDGVRDPRRMLWKE